MAEAILRADHGDQFETYSAGTVATQVNPLARAVMGEIKIDLSGHSSKTIDALPVLDFDVVITVCDDAREKCPYFPGAKKLVHRSFMDPSTIQGTHAECLEAFRKTRDKIRSWITLWAEKDFD